MYQKQKKFQRVISLLLAMIMSLSVMQPAMTYAVETGESGSTVIEVTDNEGLGEQSVGETDATDPPVDETKYVDVILKANEDRPETLDITVSNAKDTDQVIRLHLWEYDEGFFEDNEFTKTPATNVCVPGMHDKNEMLVTTADHNQLPVGYVNDEKASDCYLEFTARASDAYEFSIAFTTIERATDDVQFIVEAEIVDSDTESDNVSDPVAMKLEKVEAVVEEPTEEPTEQPTEEVTEEPTEKKPESEMLGDNPVALMSDDGDELPAILHSGEYVSPYGEEGNFSWYFTEDGVLTIESNGFVYIDDYYYFKTALGEDMSLVTSIVIKGSCFEVDGSIGYFFYGYNLKSLILSDSVERFSGWYGDSLETITLPENIDPNYINNIAGAAKNVVVSADSEKYASVDGVVYSKDMKTLLGVPGGKTGELVVPYEVESIAENAFTYTGLSKVSFEENSRLKVIEANAFYSSFYYETEDGESAVDFSNCKELKVIKSDAFAYAYVMSVNLNGCDALETIEKYAFKQASLTSISLDECKNLKTIEADAFYYCRDLSEVVVPYTVKDFYKNTYGPSLVYPDGTTPYVEVNGILYNKDMTKVAGYTQSVPDNVILPSTVKEINPGALQDAPIKSITLNYGLEKIGTDGLYGIQVSTGTITIPATVKVIDDYGLRSISKNVSLEFAPGSQLEVIGDYALYSTGIKHFDVPDTLTEIGEYAFYGSDLESISFGDYASLTTIGDYAFSQTPIKEIHLPASVDSMGYMVFLRCKSLKAATLPDGIESIPGSCFSDCTSLTEFVIPDSVTSVGGGAFSGSGLEKVYIGKQVTEILAGAFSNAYKLREVVFAEDCRLETIGAENATGVFQGCTSLRYIDLPDYLTSIPDSLFSNSGLIEITIPDSVTSIGRSAFSNCDDLQNIIIPESVKKIEGQAFSECNSLRSIVIPDSVTELGLAFYQANNYYDGNPFEFGNFTSITIPEHLVEFLLTERYEQNWDGSTIVYTAPFAAMTTLQNITVTGDGNNYTSVNGVIYTADMTEVVFAPRGIIGDVIIADTAKTIRDNAFYACKKLTSVTIPEGITTIGTEAFCDCSSLAAVNGMSGYESVVTYFSGITVGEKAFAQTSLIHEKTYGKSFTVYQDEENQTGLRATIETSLNKYSTYLPQITENNVLQYYTGESATTTISVYNPQNDAVAGSVARIYFNMSNENGKINRAVGTFTITVGRNTYTVTVKQNEAKNYYVDVPVPVAGDTISFNIVSSYANGCSGGYTHITVEILSAEEAAGRTSDQTDTYQILHWVTKPHTYTASKSNSGTATFVKESNRHYLTNLSYYISLNRNTSGVGSLSVGNDYMSYAEITDTLTLPEGLNFTDEVKTAIKNGNYYYIHKTKSGGTSSDKKAIYYVTADGETKALLTTNTSNSFASGYDFRSISLSEDEKSLTIVFVPAAYGAYNPGTYEKSNLPNTNTTITFGSNVIAADNAAKTGDKFTVQNTVSAEEEFAFSNKQTTTPVTVTKDVTVSSGSLTLTKTIQDTTTTFGSYNPYTLTVKNPGATSMLVGDLVDTLPSNFFIKAKDIEAMFADDAYNALVMTITNADITTGNSIITVTGADGNEYKTTMDDTWTYSDHIGGLKVPNTDSYVNAYEAANTATLVLAKDENGKLTVDVQLPDNNGEYASNAVYTVGEDYATLQELFDDIGFKVIFYTQYGLMWDYDAKNVSLDGGASIVNVIRSTAKNTFQMLNRDALGRYNAEYSFYKTFGTDMVANNTAYLYYANEARQYRSAAVNGTQFYMDFDLGISAWINGSYLYDNAASVGKGDVITTQMAVRHQGSASYDEVPFVGSVVGDQLVLAPVELNKNAAWASGLHTHTYNGVEYYVLSVGVYENVNIGGYLADRVVVSDIGDMGILSEIYWYMTGVSGTKTFVPKWDTLICPELTNTGSGYVKINSYVGDYEGHRLYASFGGTTYTIDKKIVSSVGDVESEGLKYSVISEGESVIYRLKLENIGEATFERVITGNLITDVLPFSIENYRWTKDNVSISYSNCTVSDESENGWEITEAQGDSQQQNIQWADDFTITLYDESYIWVTLTFPSNSGDQALWDDYAEHYAATILTNTFKCSGHNNLSQSVTHDLKVTPEVLLQKGVYKSGYLTNKAGGSGSTVISNDRSKYTMVTSSRWGFVEYYVSIYNDGNTNLYLDTIIDVLPDDFTFGSVLGTSNPNGQTIDGNTFYGLYQTSYTGNKVYKSGNVTASENYHWASVTDDHDKEVVYKTAYITATTEGEYAADDSYKGKVYFKVSNDDVGDLSYDVNRMKYYLKPGEALQFGYTAFAASHFSGSNAVATNVVGMKYYPYNGQSAMVGESDITVSDADVYAANDGTTNIIGLAEAKDLGLTKSGAETDEYLLSYVNLSTGSIQPGIKKSLQKTTSQTGIVTNNPITVEPSDTLTWAVELYNDGDFALCDYVFTDLLPAGWIFTGKVHLSSSVNWTFEDYEIDQDINSPTYGRVINYTIGDDMFTTKVPIGEYYHSRDRGWMCKIDYNENGQMYIEVIPDSNANSHYTQEWYIGVNGKITVWYSAKHITESAPNGTFINEAYITPLDQSWDGNTAKGIYVDGYPGDAEKPSVMDSNAFVVATGYATTSEISVTDDVTSANSNSSTNFIVLDPGKHDVTYTLGVTNVSGYAIGNMTIINNLPEKHDTSTFNTDQERESDFTVSLAGTPNFIVKVGNTVLTPDQYTIEYTTAVEFDAADWNGESSSKWSTDPAGARSFRVVIGDGTTGIIPANSTVTVSYDAVIEDPDSLSSGETAWNSFGYQYAVQGSAVSLQAAPLKVGIKTAGIPKLTKVIKDKNGQYYGNLKDTDFTFVIYTGKQISSVAEAESADAAIAILNENGRDYATFTLNVPKHSAISYGNSNRSGRNQVIRYLAEYVTETEAMAIVSALETASAVDYVDVYQQNHPNAADDFVVDGAFIRATIESLVATATAQYSLPENMIAHITDYLYDYQTTVSFDDVVDGAFTYLNGDVFTVWEVPEDVLTYFSHVGSSGVTHGQYTFSYHGNVNQQLSFVNTVRTTDVKVYKHWSVTSGDSTYSGAVAGAEIQLWKKSVYESSDTSKQPLATLTTGDDGYIIFKELIPGDYVIVESVVPDGYFKADDIYFTIDEMSNIVTDSSNSNLAVDENGDTYITMCDEPKGSVVIHKFEDNLFKTPLEGVTFTLTDSDGNVVEKTTDANGYLIFDELKYGTYTLVETKTVGGHELLTEAVEITIPLALTSDEVAEKNADTENALYDAEADTYVFFDMTYNISNAIAFDLPTAGGADAMAMILGAFGAMSIIAGAWFALKRKKYTYVK